MKTEEEIANKYLEQQGLGSPVFEPDGHQQPPDFTLSWQIAIEVTRLSRYLSANSELTEENIYIPFWNKLKHVLSTFDSQYNGKTYFVIIDYITPFSQNKYTRKHLDQEIKKFLNSKDIELPYRLNLNDDVSLIICKFKPITGCVFKLGSINLESGPKTRLYIDNIQRCITKKSNKIKPYKDKYPEWQLLLVDYLRWSLDIEEIEKIKASITGLGLFDSLIVISYEEKLLFRI